MHHKVCIPDYSDAYLQRKTQNKYEKYIIFHIYFKKNNYDFIK